MDQKPQERDPHATITPGGFPISSPFDRQFVPPKPVEKPVPTTKPETVVDMADLEEAHHRLEDILNAVENTQVGDKIATAGGDRLDESLEAVRNLIYRNLR